MRWLVEIFHDLDRKASAHLFRKGARVPRRVWKSLEWSGDGIIWLLLTLAVIILLSFRSPLLLSSRFLFSSPSMLSDLVIWIAFLAGLILDLVEVGLLKGLIRRGRPVYNDDAKDMKVVVAVDQYSFPSGHASRSMFIAIFCITVGADHVGMKLVALTCVWAVILGLSRCLMGRHYLGDVLAGMCVGLVTVALLTKVCRRFF